MATATQEFVIEVAGRSALEGSRRRIQETLERVGFAVIRGLLDPREVRAEYQRLVAAFDASRDIRRSGPIRFTMANFQRLDCGDYAQVNARLSRMMTRFFWNPDGMFSGALQAMQTIRDRMLARTVVYQDGCYDWNEQRYYELPKILQYPAGGGFLASHYDGYNSDGVFNIGMSVTRRGEDFTDGGLYYKFRSGEECAMEEMLQPGDLYLHDAEAVHGVHAVDATAPLDLTRLTGRVAVLLSSERLAA